MDDETKVAIEVINGIVSRVLDGVGVSLASARNEIRTNPTSRPDAFRDDLEFVLAADYGLFVAQVIVEKVNEKFREERGPLN